MKRWLLFLAVFLVGLLILWWVDRGRRPGPLPPELGPQPSDPKGPEVLTEVPIGEKNTARVGVSGAPSWNSFDRDTGELAYRVTARNAEPLGNNLYRLDEPIVRFFVPGTDRVRLETSARTGKVKLTSTLQIDPEFPIELDDVVATLREGSPFAPLTVRVPRATAVIATQRVDSDSFVEIAGKGLTASGEGLAFRGLERELRLLRATNAHLALPDGTPASISAAGGLTFTGLEQLGRGPTRVVARDKAHLEFQGAEPLEVDADSIELDAVIERELETRLRPTQARALGAVKLAPKDGKFFGDKAELELGDGGRPRSAKLTGSPRVELLLHDVDTTQVPGVTGEQSGTLEVGMKGAGPLEVDFTGDPHFDFLGPATLTVPSLTMTLTAQEKLSGTRTGTTDFGKLEAYGAVEAQSGADYLSAPALTLERRRLEDGRIAAAMTTVGRTRAMGDLEDGGTFDLTAENGLEFVRLPDGFLVPVARDVELDVKGPHAFYAKAREVRDLDGSARSFTGVGDVEFRNARGRGRGERVVARSKDSAELIGAPDSLAHCDFDQGSLDAHRIEFEGDRLRAEGEAHAHVGLPEASYDLDARWIAVTRTAAPEGQDLLLEAGGDVRAHVEDSGRVLDLSSRTLDARAFSKEEDLRGIESRGLVAAGDVVFDVTGDQELSGEGERFVIEADRSGSLLPLPGERVVAHGRLPRQSVTFEMTSTGVTFGRESLAAESPVIDIRGLDLPLGRSSAPGVASPVRAVAGALSADPDSILFTDGVYVGQTEPKESTWSLDAEKLAFTGRIVRPTPDPAAPPPEPGAEPPVRFEVASVLAWGGFRGDFAHRIASRGSTLLIDREHDRLTVRGDPAEILTEEQRLGSEWIELDLATGFLRTASGTWSPPKTATRDVVVTFASMEPAYGIASHVQVVRELRFEDKLRGLVTRASWALLWLDDARIQRQTGKLLPRTDVPLLEEPPVPPPESRPPNKFVQGLLGLDFTDWVREAYLEGNIEVLEKGDRTVRADAMYMDLVHGHGWVRDLEVVRTLKLNSQANRVRLRADLVSYAPDGSARSEHAQATTCDHEVPHYWLNLEDVQAKPRLSKKAQKARAAGETEGADETAGVDVLARGNNLNIGEWFTLPLPPLPIPIDEDGNISTEYLPFLTSVNQAEAGASSKYGFFVGASFALPIAFLTKPIGRLIGDEDSPEKVVDSSSLILKYFNARGLMPTLRHKIKQKNVFQFDTRLSVIYDQGTDRGLEPVPTTDREDLRGWLRTEGRRMLGADHWIDVRVTAQSDPGIQAEYFENDFIAFEERETYLHWRKARGLDYARATAEVQLDDFRTEVMDQPSAGYTRARAAVTRWFKHDLLYTSDTTAARMKRVEGDPAYEAPFPDGFGDEEVLRVDTNHRWELPIPLSVLDARLVPFVEARATLWDRGATDPDSASRFALLAGAELSTTFWKVLGDGDVHSLVPSIGIHSDLVVEEGGPAPARFDSVEDPIDGTFVDLGLRSRWVKPVDPRKPDHEERFLDIEVRETYAADLSGGRREEWLPLRVNAQWLSEFADIPFGATHDGRYDLDTGNAEYSRTVFGIRPVPPVEVEMGYHTGRDLAGAPLYNAWSLAAGYTVSDKWQLVGKETFSTLSGSQLESGILLRRIGHDYVIEMEYSIIAGEGGGSFSISLTPMLSYRQRSIGHLSEWARVGN